MIQHHARYLGSDPNNLPEPSSFNIGKVHFGYLAQLLLSDALSTDDIYIMLDGMGKSVERKEYRKETKDKPKEQLYSPGWQPAHIFIHV
ncbi:MAG TPA: hypothetical protein C5S51_09655 [Methanosarcinaceae archaeon]|nr:hypothetical protein [Methanosarcinaceae archaeon]